MEEERILPVLAKSYVDLPKEKLEKRIKEFFSELEKLTIKTREIGRALCSFCPEA